MSCCPLDGKTVPKVSPPETLQFISLIRLLFQTPLFLFEIGLNSHTLPWNYALSRDRECLPTPTGTGLGHLTCLG